MARNGYRYPLERLQKLGQERYTLVRFEDMIRDPAGIVSDIYDKLGFEMSPVYERILEKEAEDARSYRSRHNYSLEELGLSHERILRECGDAFERLGFDRREPADAP
jgi:hypothetical protein